MKKALSAIPAWVPGALLLGALAVPSPARAATVDINIQNYLFGAANATVTVHAGDTVRWTNKDVDSHTVTSGANRTPDSKFSSGNMDTNAVFTHTFNDVGTYPYYCEYHVGMEAAIEVLPAGATITIDIKNFRFGNNNAPVEINAGDTVVWRNLDTNITHTVTSGVRGAADAGTLFDHSFTGNANDPPTFSYTFPEPGTYPYFCRPHTIMNSSIVVKSVTPTPVRGDVNGDGKLEQGDVLEGLRMVGGLEEMPAGSLSRIDVSPDTGDGAFDIQDIIRIARYVAGTDTTPM